jgi:hypothetical protein
VRVLLGSEGGQERVVLCVSRRGYYLALKIRGQYRRTYASWLGGPLG